MPFAIRLERRGPGGLRRPAPIDQAAKQDTGGEHGTQAQSRHKTSSTFNMWLLYGLYRDSIGYIGLFEPLAAALAKAAGQGVFAMRRDAG